MATCIDTFIIRFTATIDACIEIPNPYQLDPGPAPWFVDFMFSIGNPPADSLTLTWTSEQTLNLWPDRPWQGPDRTRYSTSAGVVNQGHASSLLTGTLWLNRKTVPGRTYIGQLNLHQPD